MDKLFAENLKNARIKAGLTQAQVAEKIGVMPGSLILDIKKVYRICENLLTINVH